MYGKLKYVFSTCLLGLVLSIGPPGARAASITNGSFATGDLTGRTKVGGDTLTVVAYDPTGSGASYAVQFQAGHSDGIEQEIDVLKAGTYDFSAAFAATVTSSQDNLEGGTFQVVVDGTSEGSHNLGDMEGPQITTGLFTGSVDLSAGTHEFEILITRDFTAGAGLDQYVASISRDPKSVATPEPDSAICGLTMLTAAPFAIRKRVRSTTSH
jgi:hypothetical protein